MTLKVENFATRSSSALRRRRPTSQLEKLEITGNRTLALTDSGEGQPIILLHGALTTHTDWPAPLMDALTDGFRVLAIDRPGHGESRRGVFEGAPSAQARHINEAIEDRLNSPAIIVAHSFGALVAMAYAALFPAKTCGLVLLAPICFPEFRPVEHLYLGPRALPILGAWLSQAAASATDSMFLGMVHQLMFAPQTVPAEWRAQYPFEAILQPANLCREGEDAISPLYGAEYARLALRGIPTSVIMGTHDMVVDNRRHGAVYPFFSANCVTAYAPGSGHMVHHEAPELVLHSIRRLCARA